MASSQPGTTSDHDIGGVPLPADTRTAPAIETTLQRQWTGAWVGAWDGSLKHILLVEDVAADGSAQVVYAYGDNPYLGIRRGWSRRKGVASERSLKLSDASWSATYEVMEDAKSLKATYALGALRSHALMTRLDFADLTAPGAGIDWTGGRSEFLHTDLVEEGQAIRLETLVFKPAGAGPFPLVVINHGSTGEGTDPELFRNTWYDLGLADFLNERGWLVAFQQRRGRGKSDGLYDEGFSPERADGYSCDSARSLAGAERALRDIETAVAALRRRPDVASSRILIGGQSRGGVLSVAYAGRHPEDIAGVINFVGGWVGNRCPTAAVINQILFKQGARFGRPTLWLYGRHDPFYSIAHSQENFAAFQESGGQGTFLEFEVPGDNGHRLIGYPPLWSGPASDYLRSLAN